MALALTTRRAIALVLALASCGSCGGEAFHGSRGEAEAPASHVAAAMDSSGPTTFFDDQPLDLRSPDGRYRLVSAPSADGLTHLIAMPTFAGGKRQVVGTYDPPTAVLWSPASNAFFVNDQRGSGQSSYLEIVRLEQGRFRREAKARKSLVRLFARLFECDVTDEFINTSGESWLDASTVVVRVQASPHSGGCPLDPFAANELMLLVNASSGEVQHRSLRTP